MSAYQQSAWSLDDLFPAYDSAEVQAALAELDQHAQIIAGYREKLQPAIAVPDFLAMIHELEYGLYRPAHRLLGFAELALAADTQNNALQTFQAQMTQKLAELQNRVLFFSLWWKDLDEANAQRLLAEAGDLRYWLEAMRRMKPHTLAESEEKIINLKNTTGLSALQNLYDTITNRYTFHVRVAGQDQELTRGELMMHVRSADPELRAAAYQELYRVYGRDGDLLGQIYQTIVRDFRNEQMELRRFASPMAVRNLDNDISDQVVDTLLDVAARNVAVFQRYFRLKARLLGLPRLRRYDIYAPITPAQKTYSFAQATEMVLDSFHSFDPKLAVLARRVLDQRHLDSGVRKGKRGGAFCSALGPDLTPWVLVNYQGKADDVATLAHELGHAIHSMLAEQHSLFTQHSCLPLAETASTFGEMMLVDHLLEREPDPAVRRDLLFNQIDGDYGTIQRQIYFAMFERQAHELTSQGAGVEELSTAYLENLTGQFGDAVQVSDEFRWEWVSIPHIYNWPFYVYAYSFGQLLVLALYQQYKQEGDAFKPRYLRLLSAGGSKAPIQLLQEAGIDAHSAAFWQGGYDVLAKTVAMLEELPGQG